MLIKMPDSWVDTVRIERRAAKCAEIRNQTRVRRVAELQVLLLRDTLVHAGADESRPTEVAMKPWRVAPAHASARHADHQLNKKL